MPEKNVRKGFFERESFEEFVPHLPPYLQDFVRFAHWTGWRAGEIRSLTWSSVDLPRGELTLLDSKNNDRRTIRSPGRSWNSWCACELAGFGEMREGGLTFHDLRRTAARNHRNAGVPESVVMSITGHRTTAMFHRYGISDSEDKRCAFEAVAEHLEGVTTRPKNVVSIKRRES